MLYVVRAWSARSPVTRVVLLAAGLLLVACLGAAVLAGAITASLLPGGEASESAVQSIPPDWLSLYQEAATSCPGLSWTVLAAIGSVESDHGQSAAAGVHSGANVAGAEGPMQFEPATFASYAVVGPGGADPATPYDPVDAVYTAARYLCVDGAADGATVAQAVYDYNHSASYVDRVLSLASSYQAPPGAPDGADASVAGPPAEPPSVAAATAVGFARHQLGVPYRWGGEGQSGFDCSGLVEAAYAAAGVHLPRGAQEQYDSGPHLPAGQPLAPGDLVFFGTPTAVEHVGVYIGGDQMIDAPHTGADVRVEPDRWTDYLGATRPAGGAG